MTKLSKAMLLASVTLCVCSALDGYSTMQFLVHTYNSEKNPLFGQHPSLLRLWVEGTAIIAAEIGLVWWARSKKWLALILLAGILFQSCWQLHAYFNNTSTTSHAHVRWH